MGWGGRAGTPLYCTECSVCIKSRAGFCGAPASLAITAQILMKREVACAWREPSQQSLLVIISAFAPKLLLRAAESLQTSCFLGEGKHASRQTWSLRAAPGQPVRVRGEWVRHLGRRASPVAVIFPLSVEGCPGTGGDAAPRGPGRARPPRQRRVKPVAGTQRPSAAAARGVNACCTLSPAVCFWSAPGDIQPLRSFL